MVTLKITRTIDAANPESQTVKSESEAMSRLLKYAKREDTLVFTAQEEGRDIFKFERFPDFRR